MNKKELANKLIKIAKMLIKATEEQCKICYPFDCEDPDKHLGF